jgi:hypothetical protein
VKRCTEIQAWLDAVKGPQAFNVERFIILDDEASGMGHLMHRLVKTNFETGLTDHEADRAIELLK